MTTRIIRDYNTAQAIGEIEMTDAAYQRYVREADDGGSGTGTIRAGDLSYGHIVWSDVPADDTVVYIEE